MALPTPGHPEGLTEYSLNASGMSSLDATYARAACLAAAEHRAQVATVSRRSMEDWRKDHRCGPAAQQAEEAPSTSAVVQPLPEPSVREPWTMSPHDMQMQNQAFHHALQPHAPAQDTLDNIHAGQLNSSQALLGYVLPMPPPSAENIAPEGQQDEGGCRSKAAVCMLCFFSIVLLAAATVLVIVPHRILAHRLPHSPHRWTLPIILASAIMLVISSLLMRFFRKNLQQREGCDQARYTHRKRFLIVLSVALGLVLIKVAMLAVRGDLHMPGFLAHHHGHHGHHWNGDGNGDSHGYDYHYGDGDGDGDEDGDEQRNGEADGDGEGKGEGEREEGREYFGDSGRERKQDYEDDSDDRGNADGNGSRGDSEGEGEGDEEGEEDDDQEDSEGGGDGKNDNMVSM